MRSLGGSYLSGIYGTALNTGILAPEAGEFSWMHDIHFSNGYWKNAAKALGGILMTHTQAAELDSFTHSHLTGLEIQRIDGLAIYHYGADGAKAPILMKKNPLYPNPVFGFGGVVADFRGKREELGWAPWYFFMHYANVDNVPEATGKRYVFAGTPMPSCTDPASFINVTCSPYDAAGDGKSDDTSALQRALADAGRRGGGTVYLPQGGYRITAPLVVPTGVELRGPYGAGKSREYAQTCTLDVYCGKDSKSPETDTAFITLMSNSGIRGFTIAHPEQAYDVTQLHEYPYSIRGDGPGIWIIGVNLLNSCYGIDLAMHQCDKHIVKDLWATVFYKGINVGGDSRGGKLEHMAFSQGPWLESYMLARIATKEGNEAAASFRSHHSVDYLFGDCDGETSWGLVGFNPYVHCHFYKDKGQGCTNADFWQTAHDVGTRSDIQADSGGNINLIGYFGTGYEHQVHNWLEVGKDFTGPLNVYAKTIQQTCVAHPFRFTANQVRFFDEVSLTTGRKATASQTDPGSSPANAVDRDERTFWQAPSGSYLDVDLGQIKTVTGFGMQGPGVYCDESLNPAEAELRVSVDGKSYAAAGSVNARPGGEAQPHPYAWADTPVDPVRARYVRLYVNKPGADGKIRVSDFYVYGY
jgi:hypothetical protein